MAMPLQFCIKVKKEAIATLLRINIRLKDLYPKVDKLIDPLSPTIDEVSIFPLTVILVILPTSPTASRMTVPPRPVSEEVLMRPTLIAPEEENCREAIKSVPPAD